MTEYTDPFDTNYQKFIVYGQDKASFALFQDGFVGYISCVNIDKRVYFAGGKPGKPSYSGYAYLSNLQISMTIQYVLAAEDGCVMDALFTIQFLPNFTINGLTPFVFIESCERTK